MPQSRPTVQSTPQASRHRLENHPLKAKRRCRTSSRRMEFISIRRERSPSVLFRLGVRQRLYTTPPSCLRHAPILGRKSLGGIDQPLRGYFGQPRFLCPRTASHLDRPALPGCPAIALEHLRSSVRMPCLGSCLWLSRFNTRQPSGWRPLASNPATPSRRWNTNAVPSVASAWLSAFGSVALTISFQSTPAFQPAAPCSYQGLCRFYLRQSLGWRPLALASGSASFN